MVFIRPILCVFVVALVIIGLMCVSGCTEETEIKGQINDVKAPLENQGNQSNTKQTPTTVKASPTPKPNWNLKIGESAKDSGLQVTVLSAKRANSYTYTIIKGYPSTSTPKAGYVYILVDSEFRNIGASKEYISSGDFSMQDSTGYKYDNSIYMGDDDLPYTELLSGQHVRGITLFEVPKTAKGLILIYDFNMFLANDQAFWNIP